MLPNTLNTNEIKDSAGTEYEFTRFGTSLTDWKKVSELPTFPHRMSIKHQESGTGVTLRRRSVIRFDTTTTGQVDATQVARDSAYIVLDHQIGNHTTNTAAKNVLSFLGSFTFTLGGTSTFLYDGTGNGAVALLDGTQ
jgi:hypothetical protein